MGNEETTGTLSEERIALNQSIFRQANEKIEFAADEMQLIGPVPFICECADRTCIEIVQLTLDEYESVRDNPRLFFNAPGHETLSVNAGAAQVRERHDGYVVVEKTGLAGQIAEQKYQDLINPD